MGKNKDNKEEASQGGNRMKERFCRIGEIYGKKGIKVCKHICIDGCMYRLGDNCEYHEHLNIYCPECKRKHKLTVLVN